jgi:hypothetical protein
VLAGCIAAAVAAVVAAARHSPRNLARAHLLHSYGEVTSWSWTRPPDVGAALVPIFLRFMEVRASHLGLETIYAERVSMVFFNFSREVSGINYATADFYHIDLY